MSTTTTARPRVSVRFEDVRVGDEVSDTVQVSRVEWVDGEYVIDLCDRFGTIGIATGRPDAILSCLRVAA